MRTKKKKPDPYVLFDMRVKLLRQDAELLAFLHEDAQRNQRTMPGQVRYMLRKLMEESNDER